MGMAREARLHRDTDGPSVVRSGPHRRYVLKATPAATSEETRERMLTTFLIPHSHSYCQPSEEAAAKTRAPRITGPDLTAMDRRTQTNNGVIAAVALDRR
jgi:hypothetical protein